MMARAVLTALSILGFSNIVPITGFCHGRDVGNPSTDPELNIFWTDLTTLHSPAEKGFPTPIFVKNIGEPETNLRTNDRDHQAWDSFFDVLFNRHIWYQAADIRVFYSSRYINYGLFNPRLMKSRFPIFFPAKILKGYIPYEIPGWGLATIVSNESDARMYSIEHEFDGCCFNADIGPYLRFTDFSLFPAKSLHRIDSLLEAPGLDKKSNGLNDQNQQRRKANYERRSIIPALIVAVPCILFGFLLGLFGCEWPDNKRKFRSPALIWIGWVLFLGGVSLLFGELLRGMPANLF